MPSPKLKNATNSTTRTTPAKTQPLDSTDAVHALGLWAREITRDSRDYIPRIVVEERIFSIIRLLPLDSLDA